MNQVPVFPADGGFRVLRRESRERAERLVIREALRPEFDNVTGELLGYRILGADLKKVDSDLASIRTSVSISAWEMELNATGRSRTRGLSEDRRGELIKAGDAPEDLVERVQAKVRVWAVIGSAPGDILRVWPRTAAVSKA